MFVEGLCRFTDDSILTLAVAKALLETKAGGYIGLEEACIKYFKELARRYAHLRVWGVKFFQWAHTDYYYQANSCGNGAGMRVSAVGWIANSLEECIELSRRVTAVTHNHPEGIKGGEAIAACIYLARTGKSKAEIRAFVERNYYELNVSTARTRDIFTMLNTEELDVTCQGTVPPSITAFLDAVDFENAV
jgi:type I restriction enzyme M protein